MDREVETFSEGKSPQHNEDCLGFNETSFVLVDGMTAKKGSADKYDGRTSGEVIAKLLTEASLASDLNGPELVDYLSEKVKDLYGELNPRGVKDPQYRFAATLLVARIVGQQLHITQVGDTGFRINGGKLYRERRVIDELDAAARAGAIRRALDMGYDEITAVKLGREYIEPSLNSQHQYRNNADHWLGFAYIDGFPVPPKFIQEYTFPLEEIKTLELVSDGYLDCPNETSIEAWEAAYQRVKREDPDCYRQYLATKPDDDRSVLIVKFI